MKMLGFSLQKAVLLARGVVQVTEVRVKKNFLWYLEINHTFLITNILFILLPVILVYKMRDEVAPHVLHCCR